MNTCFVLSNDPLLRAELEEILSSAGFSVATADRTQAGLDRFYEVRPDLVYFDLSGEAGDEAARIRSLRNVIEACPLILLMDAREIGKLDPSADVQDLLVIPFRSEEVVLRGRLALWKSHKIDQHECILIRDLVLDTASYEVRIGGKPVTLTLKEYELLRYLMMNQGRVLTRDALLNRVWGIDFYGGTRTVDVHIRRLRSKIEIGGRRFIQTIRGVGYKIV